MDVQHGMSQLDTCSLVWCGAHSGSLGARWLVTAALRSQASLCTFSEVHTIQVSGPGTVFDSALHSAALRGCSLWLSKARG